MEEGSTKRPLLEQHQEEVLATPATAGHPSSSSAEGSGSLIARARTLRLGAANPSSGADGIGEDVEEGDCYALLADGPAGEASVPLQDTGRAGMRHEPPQLQSSLQNSGEVVAAASQSSRTPPRERAEGDTEVSTASPHPDVQATTREEPASSSMPSRARPQRQTEISAQSASSADAASARCQSAIEMRSFNASGGVGMGVETARGEAESPLDDSTSASPQSSPEQMEDRHCFICLQEGDKDSPLVPCCSTCYARVHVRCWREWRNNQRMTALRSRLLGLRMQTNHLLRCTICKSGTAMVAGEEDGLEWMNDLLSGGDHGEAVAGATGGPQGGAGQRGVEDSDEDDGDGQLEDLIDMRTCIALTSYLAVLIGVLMVAIGLIVMGWFYAGDVVLCSIISFYELSVLLIVSLALVRRRSSMLAMASAAAGLGGEHPATAVDAGAVANEDAHDPEGGEVEMTPREVSAHSGRRRPQWLQLALLSLRDREAAV